MPEQESIEVKIARLDEKLDFVLRDIKELKDGTTTTIADHEKRIQALERVKSYVWGVGVIGVIVLGTLATLLMNHLLGK